MTAKYEPRTMDIIAYSFAIRDKLESDYYCTIPKPHVAGGDADSYCANYIVSAYSAGTSIADAAFVLCNKIRRRDWEDKNEPVAMPGCPHCGYRHPPDGICI